MWSDDGAVRDGTLSLRDGRLSPAVVRRAGGMASFPGTSPPLSAIADSTRMQVTPKTTSLPRDLIIAG